MILKAILWQDLLTSLSPKRFCPYASPVSKFFHSWASHLAQNQGRAADFSGVFVLRKANSSRTGIHSPTLGALRWGD